MGLGECEGSGNEGPGGAVGGFGGIGAESNFQDGGKEWIIEEEGDGKGGLGSDSSAESLGTEEIDRSGNGGIEGGIDKEEDCRNTSRDCRVDLVLEDCVGVGGVKSIDMIRESHMNIFLRSVLDKRRNGSSLQFQSHSSLMSQTGHSVELNGRAQLPADFCRTSEDNHKKVKFASNNQLNNDNNDNGCGGDSNGDVGSCCSI